MTRDEILNMPAGREMDVLIAENVLRYKKGTFGIDYPVKSQHGDYMVRPIPFYSAEIAAAWEVVEKFDHVEIQRWSNGKSFYFTALLAKFSPEGHTEQYSGIVKADTVELAICRAGLLAVAPTETARDGKLSSV